MACFIVPAAEAVVAAAVRSAVKKSETARETENVISQKGETVKIPFSRKLGWLIKLLSGGSVLLMFEHFWHGEIVPWFPFLTAAAETETAVEMLKEMATTGVCMAAICFFVWIGMLIAASAVEKNAAKEAAVNE